MDIETLLSRGGIISTPQLDKPIQRHFNLNNPTDIEKLCRYNPFNCLLTKTKIVKTKTKPKEVAIKLDGEILEDFFSIKDFATQFEKQSKISKKIIIPILCKNLAFFSTLEILTDKLNSSATFEGTTYDQYIMKDITKFWSMKELCIGLEIDFEQYLDFYKNKTTKSLEVTK